MKEFNKQLNEDINRLKKLRIKKDKTEYYKFFTVVARRHKLSKTTIQAELRKTVPGTYRSINWDMRYRPITNEEVKMVYELLMQGFTLEKIKSIMEEKLGGNYSDTRMAKIRIMMEERLFELEADNTTAFGGEVCKLLKDYCNLDLMHPERIAEPELYGKKYPVNCGVIKEAMNMIIFSSEGGGKSTQEIQRIRMENMLSKKIDNMTASSQVSMVELRSAEIVRRSQEKGQAAGSLNADSKVLIACCKELSPDITYGAIYEMAKKHAASIKGSTEEIVPDVKLAMNEFQDALENTPGSGFESDEVFNKASEDGYWDMTEEEQDNWDRNWRMNKNGVKS